MPLEFGLTRIALVVAIGVTAAYFFAVGNPRSYHERLSERFIYGVPLGSLVTVVGVISFYLFAQSGLQHWDTPVTLPFRSWSYFYPEGLLTAGFAHAGSNHLISNMVGTVVLAPIVEYAWSHYPPPRKSESTSYEYPPPGDVQPEQTLVSPTENRLIRRPWVRALVVFPVAIIAISIVTSVLALGWSLGFSGTVFALGGFAVIYFPVVAIFAMVGITGTGIVVTTVREPVLRATAEPGTPGPPGWWGVNVQAHMLGFLLGVLLAIALLRHRDEQRQPVLVLAAVLTFGLTRQLWAFATGGDGVFVQQRGIGLIFLLALTILITAIFAAKDERIPTVFDGVGLIPERRTLAYLWLGAVGSVAALIWLLAGLSGIGWVGALLFVTALVILALPGLPVALPDSIVATPISGRQVLVFGLLAVALIIAVPSFASNAPGMSDDPVPGNESITVADYHVTYAEDAPHERATGNESGVIVVSEQRDIWTSVVSKNELVHNGETTVVVGGLGWRDTVDVNRTGWNLNGGDRAYVVDLNEAVRAFTSDREQAGARIANQSMAISPGPDQFHIEVSAGGEQVGSTPIPSLNETASVGELQFSHELDDERQVIVAQQEGTSVEIAQKEE